MYHGGVDWHWGQSSVTLRNSDGKKTHQFDVQGRIERVVEEIKKLDLKEPLSLCFEASTGYGHVAEVMRTVAARVRVGHPGKIRMIFKCRRKSDRIDSDKLSKLDFLDEVPEVYVPKPDTRAWRGMINYRSRRVTERSGVKSALRAHFRNCGLEMPKSPWTKKGMAAVKEVEFPEKLDALRRDEMVDEIESLTKKIKHIEAELNALGREHPGVQLLETIPGVGPRTAEAVVAWIDDPQRFSSSRKGGAYFGLVPCMDQSAGPARMGHITKEGPGVVRGLLVEASWQAIRRSATIRARFKRIRKEDPKRTKIAIVAIANYLARVMVAMLTTGEVWRGEGD